MAGPDELTGLPEEAESSPRRPPPMVLFGLVALTVVTLAAGVIWLGSGDGDELSATGDLGSVDGVVVDSFDGSQPLELSSFEGRPMVINFWASWCGPCIEEMPDFQRVHEEMGREVHFLGIDVQDAPVNARKLVRSTGVTYLLASDPDASVFREFGGLGMPTTLFVDSGGTIRERHTGPLTAAELRSRIRARLGV